jgi:hypothetical protein
MVPNRAIRAKRRLHLVALVRDLTGTLPAVKGLHAAGAGDFREFGGRSGGGCRAESEGSGDRGEELPSGKGGKW